MTAEIGIGIIPLSKFTGAPIMAYANPIATYYNAPPYVRGVVAKSCTTKRMIETQKSWDKPPINWCSTNW